jgi:glycosyltransferase involved in cell wall biosynthesis
MDTVVTRKNTVKILLETRPALDKHAGIPQQTRLLFRGLSLVEEFSIEGLLQSSTHALSKGLPPGGKTWLGALPTHKQVDRMARIVIMLEQKFFLHSHASVPLIALRRLLGLSENLTRFETRQFRDFIWRRLFARSLPSADFDVVTRRGFRVARSPWTAMHICALISRSLGYALFPRLNTVGFDVMITENPYPAVVSKGTRHVVRYHDAIPMLMPHTISNRRHHQAFHYRALRRNVESGAWFACVSEATRRELLSIFPEVESRSLTIHNMVSHDYFDETSSKNRVREIIRARLSPRIAHAHLDSTLKARLFDQNSETGSRDYLLIVSTIEPRKNHLTLLSAWERLRAEHFSGLTLIVVGSLGWHHRSILTKFVPWLERGELFMLEDVPSPELRLLYKHARATICPSVAEGFDLSGVEAMMSGGAVVASDIAVHREVYADAAEFFNPYSVSDLARAIGQVIDPACSTRRDELVSLGATIAQRYTCEAILPKWQAFLGCSSAASCDEQHANTTESSLDAFSVGS